MRRIARNGGPSGIRTRPLMSGGAAGATRFSPPAGGV